MAIAESFRLIARDCAGPAVVHRFSEASQSMPRRHDRRAQFGRAAADFVQSGIVAALAREGMRLNISDELP